MQETVAKIHYTSYSYSDELFYNYDINCDLISVEKMYKRCNQKTVNKSSYIYKFIESIFFAMMLIATLYFPYYNLTKNDNYPVFGDNLVIFSLSYIFLLVFTSYFTIVFGGLTVIPFLEWLEKKLNTKILIYECHYEFEIVEKIDEKINPESINEFLKRTAHPGISEELGIKFKNNTEEVEAKNRKKIEEQERVKKILDADAERQERLKQLYISKKEEKKIRAEWQQIMQQKDEDIKRQEEKEEKEKEEVEAKKRKKEERLKNCIKNYRNKKLNRSSKEIGARFERQIGYMYEHQGIDVSYNGIHKKLQDDGIDLILKNKKTHILIQCKNYKEKGQVHSNTIAQLVGDSVTYELEHPDIIVHRMLVTSYDNLDDRARKYLQLHKIEHFVKQYSVDYPLIKCKISSMIYHLPCNANYDTLKMNITKGDMYLETEEEAIKKGFRLANN